MYQESVLLMHKNRIFSDRPAYKYCTQRCGQYCKPTLLVEHSIGKRLTKLKYRYSDRLAQYFLNGKRRSASLTFQEEISSLREDYLRL